MTFAQWQKFSQNIEARANALAANRHDAARKLAAAHGLPYDGVCLHNASIDFDLKGWCFQNPERLKIARHCSFEFSNYQESQLADRIIGRAFRKVQYEAS